MCTICMGFNPYSAGCEYQEIRNAMGDVSDAPTSASGTLTNTDGSTPAFAGSPVGSASQTGSSGEVFDPWLSDYYWTSTELTFSFPTNGNFQTYNSPSIADQLNPQQQDAVRAVLAEISSFTGLTFTEITESPGSHAVLTFTEDTSISGAYAYSPYPHSWSDWGGDSWFGSNTVDPVVGNEDYLFFLHEIGHAMGLLHGHEFPEFVASGMDSQEYTVVTYTDYVGDTRTNNYESGNIDWSQSYQQLDIAAMQYMYGANFSSAGEVWSGNTVYSFDPTTGEMSINGIGQGAMAGNRIFRTIWDGHGTDTYDLSSYTQDLEIDLRPGKWSTFSQDQLADLNRYSTDPMYMAAGNVANALLYQDDLRSLIENAVGGSGKDKINGNQAANVLNGLDGNDMLDGRAGSDTLNGGAGNDRLSGGGGADALVGGEGYDWAIYRASGSNVFINLETGDAKGGHAAGDTLSGIERVIGSKFDDVLIGDSQDNQLRGEIGADTIRGGSGNDMIRGGAGGDTLDGGLGKDWLDYRDSNAGVTVDLQANTVSGGFAQGDTISGFERVFGSSHADTLTGDDQDNLIRSGDGNDTVNGGGGNDCIRGGNGADTMNGGIGVDTLDYRGSDAGVTINLATGSASGGEAAGDTFSNFERVLGSGFDDTLTGDAGRNVLSGFDGNDTFSGGAGNDLIDGGNGTDTVIYDSDMADYQIENSGTSWTITSTASGETDTLIGIEILAFVDASVSWNDFV